MKKGATRGPKITPEPFELNAVTLGRGEYIDVFLERPMSNCGSCGTVHRPQRIQVELRVTEDGKPQVILDEEHNAILTTFAEQFPEQQAIPRTPQATAPDHGAKEKP